MEKKLKVKQQHRYTQQRQLLYDGKAEFHRDGNHVRISYKEDDSGSNVLLDADEKMLELERIGTDIHTKLTFMNKERSKGSIVSEYGTIELEVHTYKYIKKENVIALEYDILVDGEVTDGYRIIWSLQEGL